MQCLFEKSILKFKVSVQETLKIESNVTLTVSGVFGQRLCNDLHALTCLSKLMRSRSTDEFMIANTYYFV